MKLAHEATLFIYLFVAALIATYILNSTIYLQFIGSLFLLVFIVAVDTMASLFSVLLAAARLTFYVYFIIHNSYYNILTWLLCSVPYFNYLFIQFRIPNFQFFISKWNWNTTGHNVTIRSLINKLALISCNSPQVSNATCSQCLKTKNRGTVFKSHLVYHFYKLLAWDTSIFWTWHHNIHFLHWYPLNFLALTSVFRLILKTLSQLWLGLNVAWSEMVRW